MLKLLTLSASLVALAISAWADEARFAWPLADYDGLSASFGEYRGDRLHTGIDLKTNEETGWLVKAVADGEIYRLKDRWRGYGRALYVRHDDGFVSVYAHLDRFANQGTDVLATFAVNLAAKAHVQSRKGELILRHRLLREHLERIQVRVEQDLHDRVLDTVELQLFPEDRQVPADEVGLAKLPEIRPGEMENLGPAAGVVLEDHHPVLA